ADAVADVDQNLDPVTEHDPNARTNETWVGSFPGMAFTIIVIVFVVLVLGLALVAPLRRRRTRPGIEPGPGTTAPPRQRPVEAPRPSTPVLTPEEAAAEADAVLEEAEGILEEAEPVEEPVAPPPVKPRFRDRLGKARSLFAGYIGSVLSRSTIDDETWDELEEALVRADVGVAATTTLLDDLRQRVKTEGITSPEALIEALKDDLKKSLAPADRGL